MRCIRIDPALDPLGRKRRLSARSRTGENEGMES